MSLVSKITGVHISPHGVKIEPLKALGTALTIGSFGGLGPVGAALGAIPGAGAVASGVSKVKGALAAIPGISKVGGFLKDHGDQLLAGAGAIQNANDMSHANDLLKTGQGYAQRSFDERAPLRAAGISGMLNPQTPDLSGINYGSQGNPYAISKVMPANRRPV